MTGHVLVTDDAFLDEGDDPDALQGVLRTIMDGAPDEHPPHHPQQPEHRPAPR
jgi:hypothetical protein